MKEIIFINTMQQKATTKAKVTTKSNKINSAYCLINASILK